MVNEFDASTLKDPKQDRFAILNLDEGKDFIAKNPTKNFVFKRNDGKELKSAHNNPWYVLMTVAGEVPEDKARGFSRQNIAKTAAIGMRLLVSSFWIPNGSKKIDCIHSADHGTLTISGDFMQINLELMKENLVFGTTKRDRLF